VRRRKKPESEPTEAEQRLAALIEREAEERGAELQRTLAIARAESTALLAQEERRLAEERRREFAEREAAASAELSRRLIEMQQVVEERLNAWGADLERAQQTLTDEVTRLEQRRRQVVAELEARMTADAERIGSESQDQHAQVARLREELDLAAREALVSATNELEQHAAERRRALHEVAERLRRRERELSEQIEREQTEATRRVEAMFVDIERRQVEQLERTVRRESARLSEAAATQFEATIKTAREEAARRLARELERAVNIFAREGERVLAERLAELGDTGMRRVIRAARTPTERVSDEANFRGEGSST
jgi:hypothetical protein